MPTVFVHAYGLFKPVVAASATAAVGLPPKVVLVTYDSDGKEVGRTIAVRTQRFVRGNRKLVGGLWDSLVEVPVGEHEACEITVGVVGLHPPPEEAANLAAKDADTGNGSNNDKPAKPVEDTESAGQHAPLKSSLSPNEAALANPTRNTSPSMPCAVDSDTVHAAGDAAQSAPPAPVEEGVEENLGRGGGVGGNDAEDADAGRATAGNGEGAGVTEDVALGTSIDAIGLGRPADTDRTEADGGGARPTHAPTPLDAGPSDEDSSDDAAADLATSGNRAGNADAADSSPIVFSRVESAPMGRYGWDRRCRLASSPDCRPGSVSRVSSRMSSLFRKGARRRSTVCSDGDGDEVDHGPKDIETLVGKVQITIDGSKAGRWCTVWRSVPNDGGELGLRVLSHRSLADVSASLSTRQQQQSPPQEGLCHVPSRVFLSYLRLLSETSEAAAALFGTAQEQVRGMLMKLMPIEDRARGTRRDDKEKYQKRVNDLFDHCASLVSVDVCERDDVREMCLAVLTHADVVEVDKLILRAVPEEHRVYFGEGQRARNNQVKPPAVELERIKFHSPRRVSMFANVGVQQRFARRQSGTLELASARVVATHFRERLRRSLSHASSGSSASPLVSHTLQTSRVCSPLTPMESLDIVETPSTFSALSPVSPPTTIDATPQTARMRKVSILPLAEDALQSKRCQGSGDVRRTGSDTASDDVQRTESAASIALSGASFNTGVYLATGLGLIDERNLMITRDAFFTIVAQVLFIHRWGRGTDFEGVDLREFMEMKLSAETKRIEALLFSQGVCKGQHPPALTKVSDIQVLRFDTAYWTVDDTNMTDEEAGILGIQHYKYRRYLKAKIKGNDPSINAFEKNRLSCKFKLMPYADQLGELLQLNEDWAMLDTPTTTPRAMSKRATLLCMQMRASLKAKAKRRPKKLEASKAAEKKKLSREKSMSHLSKCAPPTAARVRTIVSGLQYVADAYKASGAGSAGYKDAVRRLYVAFGPDATSGPSQGAEAGQDAGGVGAMPEAVPRQAVRDAMLCIVGDEWLVDGCIDGRRSDESESGGDGRPFVISPLDAGTVSSSQGTPITWRSGSVATTVYACDSPRSPRAHSTFTQPDGTRAGGVSADTAQDDPPPKLLKAFGSRSRLRLKDINSPTVGVAEGAFTSTSAGVTSPAIMSSGCDSTEEDAPTPLLINTPSVIRMKPAVVGTPGTTMTAASAGGSLRRVRFGSEDAVQPVFIEPAGSDTATTTTACASPNHDAPSARPLISGDGNDAIPEVDVQSATPVPSPAASAASSASPRGRKGCGASAWNAHVSVPTLREVEAAEDQGDSDEADEDGKPTPVHSGSNLHSTAAHDDDDDDDDDEFAHLRYFTMTSLLSAWARWGSSCPGSESTATATAGVVVPAATHADTGDVGVAAEGTLAEILVIPASPEIPVRLALKGIEEQGGSAGAASCDDSESDQRMGVKPESKCREWFAQRRERMTLQLKVDGSAPASGGTRVSPSASAPLPNAQQRVVDDFAALFHVVTKSGGDTGGAGTVSSPRRTPKRRLASINTDYTERETQRERALSRSNVDDGASSRRGSSATSTASAPWTLLSPPTAGLDAPLPHGGSTAAVVRTPTRCSPMHDNPRVGVFDSKFDDIAENPDGLRVTVRRLRQLSILCDNVVTRRRSSAVSAGKQRTELRGDRGEQQLQLHADAGAGATSPAPDGTTRADDDVERLLSMLIAKSAEDQSRRSLTKHDPDAAGPAGEGASSSRAPCASATSPLLQRPALQRVWSLGLPEAAFFADEDGQSDAASVSLLNLSRNLEHFGDGSERCTGGVADAVEQLQASCSRTARGLVRAVTRQMVRQITGACSSLSSLTRTATGSPVVRSPAMPIGGGNLQSLLEDFNNRLRAVASDRSLALSEDSSIGSSTELYRVLSSMTGMNAQLTTQQQQPQGPASTTADGAATDANQLYKSVIESVGLVQRALELVGDLPVSTPRVDGEPTTPVSTTSASGSGARSVDEASGGGGVTSETSSPFRGRRLLSSQRPSSASTTGFLAVPTSDAGERRVSAGKFGGGTRRLTSMMREATAMLECSAKSDGSDSLGEQASSRERSSSASSSAESMSSSSTAAESGTVSDDSLGERLRTPRARGKHAKRHNREQTAAMGGGVDAAHAALGTAATQPAGSPDSAGDKMPSPARPRQQQLPPPPQQQQHTTPRSSIATAGGRPSLIVPASPSSKIPSRRSVNFSLGPSGGDAGDAGSSVSSRPRPCVPLSPTAATPVTRRFTVSPTGPRTLTFPAFQTAMDTLLGDAAVLESIQSVNVKMVMGALLRSSAVRASSHHQSMARQPMSPTVYAGSHPGRLSQQRMSSSFVLGGMSRGASTHSLVSGSGARSPSVFVLPRCISTLLSPVSGRKKSSVFLTPTTAAAAAAAATAGTAVAEGSSPSTTPLVDIISPGSSPSPRGLSVRMLSKVMMKARPRQLSQGGADLEQSMRDMSMSLLGSSRAATIYRLKHWQPAEEQVFRTGVAHYRYRERLKLRVGDMAAASSAGSPTTPATRARAGLDIKLKLMEYAADFAALLDHEKCEGYGGAEVTTPPATPEPLDGFEKEVLARLVREVVVKRQEAQRQRREERERKIRRQQQERGFKIDARTLQRAFDHPSTAARANAKTHARLRERSPTPPHTARGVETRQQHSPTKPRTGTRTSTARTKHLYKHPALADTGFLGTRRRRHAQPQQRPRPTEGRIPVGKGPHRHNQGGGRGGASNGAGGDDLYVVGFDDAGAPLVWHDGCAWETLNDVAGRDKDPSEEVRRSCRRFEVYTTLPDHGCAGEVRQAWRPVASAVKEATAVAAGEAPPRPDVFAKEDRPKAGKCRIPAAAAACGAIRLDEVVPFNYLARPSYLSAASPSGSPSASPRARSGSPRSLFSIPGRPSVASSAGGGGRASRASSARRGLPPAARDGAAWSPRDFTHTHAVFRTPVPPSPSDPARARMLQRQARQREEYIARYCR